MQKIIKIMNLRIFNRSVLIHTNPSAQFNDIFKLHTKLI